MAVPTARGYNVIGARGHKEEFPFAPETPDDCWMYPWPWQKGYCRCAVQTDNCDVTTTLYASTMATKLEVVTVTVLTLTDAVDPPPVTETVTTTHTTTTTVSP